MPAQTLAPEPSVDELKAIVVAGTVRIPGWIQDLESFRRWCLSGEYPERGDVLYLDGEIWVDLSMEEFFTHNQVKNQFTARLTALVEAADLGRVCADRMRLVNRTAHLSCEPDAMFASWETFRTGRLRPVKGAKRGFMELEGTPDMVLETLSDASEAKDLERLRTLYWRAGIAEYWLVDVREERMQFDVLHRAAKGYVATRKQSGWVRSAVFGHKFSLERLSDPLGEPRFRLHCQEL